MSTTEESTLLAKLDAVVPQLDAFPKLPSTYKARSQSRGFMTLFVALLAFILILNDLGEYIWGWPEYHFSIDSSRQRYLNINVDLVVNMPCNFLSVDLRDALGDRLFLTGGLRRDGTIFDVGQATALKEHAQALSARQAIAQSRKSRGIFATLFRRSIPDFKPTYNYKADASACRIAGTLMVKRVTANLHITTLGHGYASYEHVDHNQMNLSHVITEFSFGPHFPDMTQPLDNSFEVTNEHFIAYQYFLHVVPTTYIAPRTSPLQTHQYSVTHYTRLLSHDQGTPGIFFKFDLDPLAITLHQKTTTLTQLFIRCIGLVGGVFVCMGYAIRITIRAVEVVSGADNTPGLVAAEASGAKVGLRAKWGGSELRARTKSGKMVRQGNGWVLEGGAGSPYASYAGTPASATFPSPATPGSGVGLGFPGMAFGPGTPGTPGGRTQRPLSGVGLPPPPPMTPRTPSVGSVGDASWVAVPSSPSGGSVHVGLPPPPRRVSPKKDD